MKKFTYIIKDELGIHARPAGLLAREAQKYQSHIIMTRNGRSVDINRLMALMGLGVKCGDEVLLEIEGIDESAACKGLLAFFENTL